MLVGGVPVGGGGGSGVNFINILSKTFTSTDPKSTKSSCQYPFAILGSAHMKAVSKMLMKLTGWVEKVSQIICMISNSKF